jgi:hypothetical protein
MQSFLLLWVRVLLLIRSITSTTWDHQAWPHVKPLLRRALETRRQIARDRWVELDPAALGPCSVASRAPDRLPDRVRLHAYAGVGVRRMKLALIGRQTATIK